MRVSHDEQVIGPGRRGGAEQPPLGGVEVLALVNDHVAVRRVRPRGEQRGGGVGELQVGVLVVLPQGADDLLDRRPRLEALTGGTPAIVDPPGLRTLWSTAAEGTGLSPVFLEREWEQVVLAQQIGDPATYLAARRRGQGRSLTGSPDAGGGN